MRGLLTQNIVAKLFSLTWFGLLVQSETITIYEHVGRQGDSLQMSVEGCTPFPTHQSWNDRVSSIDNHGKCITLHDNGDCSGRYIDLLPRDADQFNLYSAKFDDMASSASPCTRDYRGVHIEDGHYYIESTEDDSALTTEPQRAGDALSQVVMEDAIDAETQKWAVAKYNKSSKVNGYTVIPRKHKINPVTTNVRERGDVKNIWHFLPGLGGKYRIYRHTHRGGNICLVNKGFGNPVGETFCEHSAKNQQWVLRKVDAAY
ncbi:unnamed protein product [Allacma fusca]|uniref:Ricin B lectin domain-containing protein n=1 Tax=Allacma fusca TaxID=39272 RepID=A0A8J2JY97_9HEXA|nr:unnamed protein product [Allacma fusca]